MLTPDTVVLACPEVMRRVQPDGILLYQTRTDQMHVIPPAAFTLLRMCEGGRTVADLEKELGDRQPEFATTAGRERVEQFLEALAERRLLEVWR